MTLTDPTDEQLNAAFAEKVAGWTCKTFPNGVCPSLKHWSDEFGNTVSINWPKYHWATSADAVLPWLEKCYHVDVSWLINRAEHGDQWCVKIRQKDGIVHRGDSNSFAIAATIALLRAHGVTVNFTKP